MLLAEPRAVRRSDVLSVVYALDVSDSMGAKVSDQALGWIMQTVDAEAAEGRGGPRGLRARCRGRAAAARRRFPFEAMNSRVARDGTDLAKALSLAAAMLPEETSGAHRAASPTATKPKAACSRSSTS